MSLENDFVAFAIGGGANVLTPSVYQANAAFSPGQQPGVASSALNNTALRNATFVTAQLSQLISNITQTAMLDNGISAQYLAQITAALQPKAPSVQSFLSGTGTYNASYIFQIASGNATTGATYTNNSVTYTVVSTVSASTVVTMRGNSTPTASGTLTKASGTGDSTLTFYAVSAPAYIRVKAIGGGGQGGGYSTGGVGQAGGNTTFGANITAGGGGGGINGAGTDIGGSGGTNTISSGTAVKNLVGGIGNAGELTQTGGTGTCGGSGGVGYHGGAGGVGAGAGSPTAAAANSGGGGAGSGGSAAANAGAGGGSGGYVEVIMTGILTAAVSIGAGGSTGSSAGSNGGSGMVVVEEHYQ